MAILSTLIGSLKDSLLDWQFIGVTIGACIAGQIIYDEFFSPGSKIPGPRPRFLSRFATIYYSISGAMMNYQYDLYKKYGNVVLVRPNIVALADPDAVRMISTSTKLVKADVYHSFQFHRDNIFSTQDVAFHRKLKRTIGPVFSLASVSDMEPLVYEAGLKHLVRRINEYAESGKTFDVMELLHYTTLDVIGAVSFGGSFETLIVKPGEKPHPIIHWISDITLLGIMKQVFGRFCNRWTFPKHFKSERQIAEFTREVILKRMAKQLEAENEDIPEGTGKDVLMRLIESEDPETGDKLDIEQLIAESIIQLLIAMTSIGGSDTTALTTTWALHLLHDHPKVLHKLLEEVKDICPDRTHNIQHHEIKNLPYLNATLYEVMRIRPVAGGSMRNSPPGGIDLCGVHVPEGHSIGVSLYSMHFSTKVYGEDADKFRPERWIEADSEQLKLMRQSFMTFSMGSRSCIGQNLAWMELRLLLATLVRQFEFVVPAGEEVDMRPAFRFTSQPRGGCYKLRATLRLD
ncbi:cytochrome P450 [Syncephalis fuscata]|nr:cytochrome P450 [Syncephalis fuscata]